MEQREIEEAITEIRERNRRVEGDKAWETSWFRIIVVAAITYLIAVWFMHVIKVGDYWLNALVPTLGFLISTQSLPFLKKWWIRNRFDKK